MKYHDLKDVRFTDSAIVLTIDGAECKFELSAISDKLAKASHDELQAYEVSPSGYGIHWSLLDEDLSIDGLLGIEHHPSSQAQEKSNL